MSLFKTTIIIWSKDDPTDKYELEALAREATEGSMYCSSLQACEVLHPEDDSDWDETEFFFKSDTV